MIDSDGDERKGECLFVASEMRAPGDTFWIYDLKGLQFNEETIRIGFENVRWELDGEGGFDVEYDDVVYAGGAFGKSIDDALRYWHDAAINDELRATLRECN